jgi:MinD-like ATPase involved in chromosome partitioning or flagellar assembly
VLNQARTDLNGDDAHIAHDMASACRRFLGIHLEVLAILPEDEAVRRAVRVRQPLRSVAPDAPIKKALDKLAEAILLGPLDHEAAA